MGKRSSGTLAKGRRFTFEVPEGWQVLYGEEACGRSVAAINRPLMEGETADSTDGDCITVLYCTMGDDYDLSTDKGMGPLVRESGTQDMVYLLHTAMANYPEREGAAVWMPQFVNEETVEAHGIGCQVLKVRGFFDAISDDDFAEYQIKPLAVDNNDYLRVISQHSPVSLDEFHRIVCEIASTVKPDKGIVPECVRELQRGLTEAIDAETFLETARHVLTPYVGAPKLLFEPEVRRAQLVNDDPIEAIVTGLGYFIDFFNRRYVQFARLLDVIEFQKGIGTPKNELAEMLQTCINLDVNTQMPPIGIFGDEVVRGVAERNLLEPTAECLDFRSRAEKLADELGVDAPLRIDPMESAPAGGFPVPEFVLGLLSEDFFYFPGDYITWDGSHHQISGVDANKSTFAQLMDRVHSAWSSDMEDPDEVVQYLLGFLNEVEQDEALHVPRNCIERSIRGPVCDGMNKGEGGDLTGITLANLAAMGGAIRLMDDDDRDSYKVLLDARLAQGIPQFYNLVARLIWDLRACSHSLEGKPFTIRFVLARNLSADKYFGCDPFFDPVVGYQPNPGSLRVTSAPEINLPAPSTEDEDANPNSLAARMRRSAALIAGKADETHEEPDAQTRYGHKPEPDATPIDWIHPSQADLEHIDKVLLDVLTDFPRVTYGMPYPAKSGFVQKGNEFIEGMFAGDEVQLVSDWTSAKNHAVIHVMGDQQTRICRVFRDRANANVVSALACLLPHITAHIHALKPISWNKKDSPDVTMRLDIEPVDIDRVFDEVHELLAQVPRDRVLSSQKGC